LQTPIIIAIAITIGVAAIAAIIMIQRTPELVVVESERGAIIGDSWRYAGNETLYGSIPQQVCPILGTVTGAGINCPYIPSMQAEKYVNANGTSAYLLTGTLGGNMINRAGDKVPPTKVYIVVINSKVYCVTTNPAVTETSNPYSKCSSIAG